MNTYPITIDKASVKIGDNTANYDITVVPGTLTITKSSAAIKVVPGSGSKVYDGTALTKTAHDDFTVTGVPEGFTWTAAADGTVTNVTPGEGEKAVNAVTEFKIFNADNEDVTDQFANIDKSATGTLTINPRPITMTSATDSKVYDGKALTNSTVTVTGDDFADGEGATYNVTGSQTLVGNSENTFTYTLKEGTKAGNYEIKTVFGTLTVTDGTPDEPVEPDLVVTKSHTGSDFKLGDTVTFNIIATNIYEEPQTITLSEIDGVTLAESVFEMVEGGKTISTTATYTITEADILAEKFENTVKAKLGNIEKEATDTVTADELEGKNGHLTITKETTSEPANGETYALGEEITYEITVTNDGNLTITDIEVEDELTGETWTIASLAPGAEEVFPTSYTVTEADILAGEVVNVATGKGTSPDPDEPDVPVVPGVDPEPTEEKNGHLTITKETTSEPANGETYALGEEITYEITVTNDGNLTITDIEVEDELTGETWTIASLAPGAEEVFPTSYTVTEADILAGEVVNVATGKGTSPDPDEPDVPVVPGVDPEPTEEKNSHLTIVKTTTSTPTKAEGYMPDETITYQITVTNDGNVTITGITVTDELTGDEWPIDSLVPGASWTNTAEYTVKAEDVIAGSVRNEATATGVDPEDEEPDVVPGVKEDPTTPGDDNTVTPQPEDDTETMNVAARSITAKYDGNAHSVTATASKAGSTITYSVDGGTTWTATAPSLTDVGSIEFLVKAENPAYEDAISAVYTLVVTPREVVLTSASGAKYFDGTPIRRNNPATHVTVSGDGFVTGEGATYTITGVQTDIGASNNTFTYALNEGTKAENYTITQVLGRLMIMPEEVPLGIIGSVSLLFTSDTNLTAEGKKADAYKDMYAWIKENNPRLGALALIGTGNAVADRNDEDAWKLIKDELDKLERAPGYLPYYNIAGRNEVNGDELDYESYIAHKLCEVNEWNEYENGQIWYQPFNEQQLLLVGIGYQKTLDPDTATDEELEAQERWLRYVNNVIARYPDYTVVLLVNDFIEHDPDSQRDDGRLTKFGELLESEIVAANENVALVLCGNAEGTARWNKTYGERNVNAIMYNYSNDEENGLGFFRIVTLNGEARTITVTTYSPTLDKDSYDEDHPEYDFFVIENAF